MQVAFQCDACYKQRDEPYETFNANNPQSSGKFFIVCKGCAKKAEFKREWVATCVNGYKGWLGPLGRAWAAFYAGYTFEREWTVSNYMAGKLDSKPVTKEMIDDVVTCGRRPKAGDILLQTLPADSDATAQPVPDVTWNSRDLAERTKCARHAAMQREEDENQSKGKPDMNEYITASQLLSLIIERMREDHPFKEGWGAHAIRWGNHTVQIEVQKFQKMRYLLDGVQITEDQLDSFLRARQIESKFTGLALRNFECVWTLTAVFDDDGAFEEQNISCGVAGEAEALDPVKPESALDLDFNAPRKNWQAELVDSIARGFDLAGGADYTVVMEYKRVGDVEKGTARIEVRGVERVENQLRQEPLDISITAADSGGKTPQEIAADINAGFADVLAKTARELADAADLSGGQVMGTEKADGIDLSYGSEFDKAMLAVYDALEEFKGTRLSHLLSKKSWNDFYAIAKHYRQTMHDKEGSV